MVAFDIIHPFGSVDDLAMALRKITTKDGSWYRVDANDVTDGDHSIDVKYKDWTGTTHRHHIDKGDITQDVEWSPGSFVAIGAVVFILLMLASNC
jgi:hypothetical protein